MNDEKFETEDAILARSSLADHEAKLDLASQAILQNSQFKLEQAIADDVDEISQPDTVLEAKIVAPQPVLDDDLAEASKNLKDLISKANHTLRSLLVLAGSSESPRAYEVVNQLISNIAAMNKDLLELHERRAKIQAIHAKAALPQAGGTTNNIIAVGSFNDVLDMIEANIDTDDAEQQ